ncbi:MAG: YitT family protein, partial [Bacteroidetes bacterium]|nr:YitT family protein [Bacteroidota bacterium]
MNPIFQYIIVETVKHHLNKKKKKVTSNQFDKEIKNVSVEFSHVVRDGFFILLGILSACFGLKGFLLPSSFIDGGVTGISMITCELTEIPLSVLLILINIPFLILA